MSSRLTQEEFESRVQQCVGDRYSVIGEYQGKTKPVLMHCNVHDIDFSVTAECFMRGSKDIRGTCEKCQEEMLNEKFESSREHIECAYCGKQFVRKKSKLPKSRSGLYFCCREHKDLAQRIGSGEQFDCMRPPHFGDMHRDYRTIAFNHYPSECAVCGYHDDDDISLLEVHHIDEDRENNDIENLIVLCPNCHRKLTSNKYVLIGRKQIVKKIQSPE